MNKCVVVKFHDEEHYAVSVYSGTAQECEKHASYCRGLYHDVPYVKFGIYEAGHYDMCAKLERQGRGDIYNLLANSNCTSRAISISILYE